MSIDDIGYIEDIRGRLGLNENDNSKDDEILKMSPWKRVCLICGWNLGDDSWAETFRSYCESQGIYLTTSDECASIDD